VLWGQAIVNGQYGTARPVHESTHWRVYVLVGAKRPATRVEVDDNGDWAVTFRHIEAGWNIRDTGDEKILDVCYALGLTGERSHAR
jgi:hypothetical protein